MTEIEFGGGLLFEATLRRLDLIGRQAVLDVAATETVEVRILRFKIGC